MLRVALASPLVQTLFAQLRHQTVDDYASPARTTFLIKGLVGLRQEIRDYTHTRTRVHTPCDIGDSARIDD